VIVLDASALVELILNTPLGQAVAARIADPAEAIHTVHLADLEVVQALRRLVRERRIDPQTAEAALGDYRALDLVRHAHEPLLDRGWELRGSVTAYDAAYAALGEALGTTVFTCDGPLSRATAVKGRFELVEARD
jgi:predicted nucleic acid-binding protein